MTARLMIDVAGEELTAEDRELIAHPLVAGVILFTRNFSSCEQVRALVQDMRSASDTPLVIAVDQEGGRVQRFRAPLTTIPAMAKFGQLLDSSKETALQRLQDCAWLMSCELRNVDADLNFAPVLDLDYGCSEVIGDRAFHADPNSVALLASAFVAGAHSGGVAACGKHFPGHGAVREDSHLALPQDLRSRQEVSRDLLPFQKLIDSGLDSLMTAHLVSSCEDEQPVSFSTRWLIEILRQQMGFRGIVFSDDLSMQGAQLAGGILQSVNNAAAAGCQFLPICNDRIAVITVLEAAPDLGVSPDFSALMATQDVIENYAKTRRYQITRDFLQTL